MIDIKIGNESLDLFDNTSIRLVQVNPLFTDDIDYPSHSYQFQIPHSPRNSRILERPDVLLKRGTRYEFDAEMYFDGVRMFVCVLNIKDAGPYSPFVGSLAINEGPLAIAAKEKNLREFNYGGIRNISNPLNKGQVANTTMLTHAKSTTLSSGFDYVFFPVQNSLFYPQGLKSIFLDPLDIVNYYYDNAFVNYYVYINASLADSNCQLVPFLYLNFVLRSIFEELGFPLEDTTWLTDPEIKTCVLYNTYSLELSGSLVDYVYAIDPSKHVPDINSAAFLKGLFKFFGLEPFINKNKRVRLLSKNDVLDNLEQVDWTQKVLQPYTRNFEAPVGWAFFSDQDGADELNGGDYLKNEAPETITGEVWDFASLPTASGSGDFFLVQRENKIYQDQDSVWVEYGFYLYPVKYGDGKSPYQSEFSTLQHKIWDGAKTYGKVSGRIPWAEQAGAADAWPPFRNDYTPRLMFYRGMVTDVVGYGPYPQGGIDDRDGDFKYSLYWHGEKGVYNTWHKRWMEAVLSNQPATFNSALDLVDLRTLKFELRHRFRTLEGDLIGFIRQIETVFTMKGISPSVLEVQQVWQ